MCIRDSSDGVGTVAVIDNFTSDAATFVAFVAFIAFSAGFASVTFLTIFNDGWSCFAITIYDSNSVSTVSYTHLIPDCRLCKTIQH